MNNPPAFPRTQWPNETGMTLRDYFAAEAISFIQWNKDHNGLCAKKCYEIADAMLKAREA
jgi:hypothetical protein